MAKFIRVTNIAQGIDMDTILNVDDIRAHLYWP